MQDISSFVRTENVGEVAAHMASLLAEADLEWPTAAAWLGVVQSALEKPSGDRSGGLHTQT